MSDDCSIEVSSSTQPSKRIMSFDASSVTLRFLIVIVIVMILGLLIPLLFVQSLIFDRQQFQRQVEDDIARSWAGTNESTAQYLRFHTKYLPLKMKAKHSIEG